MLCQACGGTILPHAIAGSPRGTCHCPRGPGHIISHLYYGTPERPGGWQEYEIEWQGRIIRADPRTLTNTVKTLNDLRTEWNAAEASRTPHKLVRRLPK